MAACFQVWYHGLLPLLLLSVIAPPFIGITPSNALYYLATPRRHCQIPAVNNRTLDIICQHYDHSKNVLQQPCQLQSVQWQRMAVNGAGNISDNDKYGVWEAIPGWGMERGEHVFLLRIRRVRVDDVGLYRCQVKCRTDGGSIETVNNMADVCLQHPHSKFALCGSHIRRTTCADAFWNGVCDSDCATEEHLYDGFDCDPQSLQCQPTADNRCYEGFGDGVCDLDCNTPECGWDGGDCIDQPLQFADDTLVLVLPSWYQLSSKQVDFKSLGRSLSLLLRTVVRILPEEWRDESVRRYTTSSAATTSSRNGKKLSAKYQIVEDKKTERRKIYMKLDNTMCASKCFSNAAAAAKYIAVSLKNGWDPGVSISSVAALTRIEGRCPLENNTLLHIDLDAETKDNYFSYGQSQVKSAQIATWVIIVANLAGLACIVVIVAIIVIVCRLRKLSNEKTRLENVERIQSDKTGAHGTDV